MKNNPKQKVLEEVLQQLEQLALVQSAHLPTISFKRDSSIDAETAHPEVRSALNQLQVAIENYRAHRHNERIKSDCRSQRRVREGEVSDSRRVIRAMLGKPHRAELIAKQSASLHTRRLLVIGSTDQTASLNHANADTEKDIDMNATPWGAFPSTTRDITIQLAKALDEAEQLPDKGKDIERTYLAYEVARILSSELGITPTTARDDVIAGQNTGGRGGASYCRLLRKVFVLCGIHVISIEADMRYGLELLKNPRGDDIGNSA